MPSFDEIEEQQRLLATHRERLAILLEQQASFGMLYAPAHIILDIKQTRSAILRTKATLSDWGEEVRDHPNDALPPLILGIHSNQAELGLTAMADLLRVPDVRARVEGFQDSFRTVCQQIDRLSHYKDLHDLLHDLQFNCHNPLIRGARDFPQNSLFLESLEDYAVELQQIINGLWEVAERASFATNEQAWIRQFSPTVDLLRGAIEHSNKELLNRAMFQIGRVIYIHPTRINGLLKETARNLPLPSLIKAMVSVQHYLMRSDLAGEQQQQIGQGIVAVEQQVIHSDLGAEKLHQLGQGVAALEQLSQSLVLMIDEHDTWQEIELELHRIEEDFERHTQELEWLWPDLKESLILLCDTHSDRWSQELRQACERLDIALALQIPAHIAAAFRPFRRQAGLCFFQADKQLKEMCRSLRRVDGPLHSVLRVIA